MEDSLHYRLMASHLSLQKQLFSSLKQTGLTFGQPKILDYLQDHNGSNQKEIALACHIEAAFPHVFLTDKGWAMQKIVAEKFEELEAAAFAGFSFITRATLGTSPISSIPYVLSMQFPFTLGKFTIAFGYFIDLTMLLLDALNPASYLQQMAALFVGFIARFFGRILSFLPARLFPQDPAPSASDHPDRDGLQQTGRREQPQQSHGHCAVRLLRLPWKNHSSRPSNCRR